ncbi:hypothetical protein [Undibacterium sp. JH2W]|uniref:hypothetical protein n=1 Tax=Undibacterium sp. JH2W TaxID=3413037 RepID=UPI003BF50092
MDKVDISLEECIDPPDAVLFFASQVHEYRTWQVRGLNGKRAILLIAGWDKKLSYPIYFVHIIRQTIAKQEGKLKQGKKTNKSEKPLHIVR